MSWLEIFNISICILFLLAYSYQVFYVILSFFSKPVRFPAVPKVHRFAILIAARNEERVLGNLCESIRKQDYPAELIDTYVVCDHCTDRTKSVAEKHGATVYERTENDGVGKGYALSHLFSCLLRDKGKEYYDAYIIVDADNLLDRHFVTEMDKCMSADHKIVTSYRNSINFGDNWISSGYAIWFMREARSLNIPRFLLGVSSEVKGTGFLVHRDIINEQGGWIHHLLIEDIEFTVDRVTKGDKIAYCHDAIIYDEQPTRFRQSFRQRKRWCRGLLQVQRHYFPKLLWNFITGKGFSNYDMIFAMAPAFLLTVLALFVNTAAAIYGLLFDHSFLLHVLLSVGISTVSGYLLALFLAVITEIYEWDRIDAPTHRKILSFFTFPIFMGTYIPIAAAAIFSKAKWKPIEHQGNRKGKKSR